MMDQLLHDQLMNQLPHEMMDHSLYDGLRKSTSVSAIFNFFYVIYTSETCSLRKSTSVTYESRLSGLFTFLHIYTQIKKMTIYIDATKQTWQEQ